MAGHVGAAGLTLAAAHPGLLATVDQHAAEIRDALPSRAGGSRREALLGYARGFVEAAIGRGWRPGAGADWESLRLAAVCQLMTQAQAQPG